MKNVLLVLYILVGGNALAVDYPFYRNAECTYASDGHTGNLELYLNKDSADEGRAFITIDSAQFPKVADTGNFKQQAKGALAKLEIRTSIGFLVQLEYLPGVKNEIQKTTGTILMGTNKLELSCDFIAYRRD